VSWDDPGVAAGWDAVAAASPSREAQVDLLLDVLAGADPREVLELGVGSGLIAELVLDRLPDVHLTGIDSSEAMLELARGRLERFEGRVTLVRGDLAAPESIGLTRPLEAAFSVQTLHHLDDPGKERALRWLGSRLPLGALFLMRDKVTVPDLLFDAYAAAWERAGTPMSARPDEYAHTLREKGDRPADLAVQLGWFAAAGFEVGVIDAEAHYALFAARRR
jgi:tRNA (cmo5U34)-methyltransferase